MKKNIYIWYQNQVCNVTYSEMTANTHFQGCFAYIPFFISVWRQIDKSGSMTIHQEIIPKEFKTELLLLGVLK